MIPFFSNHVKHRSKFRGNTSSRGWDTKVIPPPMRWGKCSDVSIHHFVEECWGEELKTEDMLISQVNVKIILYYSECVQSETFLIS